MGLFSRKPKSGQHFIVIFDIGSASIGGAFVSVDKGRTPEIIYSTRRDIPFQEKLNFERFLTLMIKTLEEIFLAMQKAGGGVRVDGAYCILASPWYASQTRLVKYTQPQPFVVTEKGLGRLIEKEIGIFRNSNLFAKSKVGDTPPAIMESKTIRIFLNGYGTEKPFGLRSPSIEAALYISMMPKNIHSSIGDSIMKFWGLRQVFFSSFSFTAFDTIRDIFSEEHSFLFMDISGEVTDISLVRDGILLESISFPVGKNALIRAMVAEMGMPPASAATELDLYLAGKSNRDHAKQVEEVLGAATKDWAVFFVDAITQFATEYPIPRTIFYIADENVMKWYDDAIREADASAVAQVDGSFITKPMSNVFLSKFVQTLEPLFQDSFLTMETIYANKFISLTK